MFLFRLFIIILCFSGYVYSDGADQTPSDEGGIQDMSDPLAVYTQFGMGATNKGINIKIGQSYDPGVPATMAMNIIEVMGAMGETLGWDGSGQRDDSINAFRFRNFKVDTTNGRGSQIDVNFNLDKNFMADQTGDVSYSIIQALPKMGAFNFYPLAGVGVAFGENVLEDDGTIDSGYSVMGTFGLVGMYAKFAVTDKFWLNYNPFWLSSLSGSDLYKDNAYGPEEDTLLTHEFIVSYQFTPRFNIRAFANWNENTDLSNGDHRVEFNYQL